MRFYPLQYADLVFGFKIVALFAVGHVVVAAIQALKHRFGG